MSSTNRRSVWNLVYRKRSWYMLRKRSRINLFKNERQCRLFRKIFKLMIIASSLIGCLFLYLDLIGRERNFVSSIWKPREETPTSSDTQMQLTGEPKWTDEEIYLESESMLDVFSYWKRRKRCFCDLKTECNTCPEFYKDAFRKVSKLLFCFAFFLTENRFDWLKTSTQ